MSLDVSVRDDAAGESAAQGSTEIVNSPFCREIRSKRFFFLREMPTEPHHLKDGSNHCWCRVTMKVYGPDGEITRPTDCVAGRSCYKSLFEPE